MKNFLIIIVLYFSINKLTKFLKENVVVAEARVDLVLIKRSGKEFSVMRKIPDQIATPLLKLQCGPGLHR